MSENIFQHLRDIDRAHLSGMLQGDKGSAKLEIRLYYHKDARRRGLKLSVFRTLETDFGHSYDIMNAHNGLVHLADMPRKPSAKVAGQWSAAVSKRLDQIAAIALASDRPDWKAVAALFEGVAA